MNKLLIVQTTTRPFQYVVERFELKTITNQGNEINAIKDDMRRLKSYIYKT